MAAPLPPTPVLVEFLGVHKAFGDNVVYENLDLTVMRGETLTIIGGSGQGKSVCLKLMIGLLRADAGVCLLYTSPSPRDRTRSRMPSSA